MSYRLDDFTTPKMYQALLGTNATVNVNGTVPFNSLTGDAGLSISSGLITLQAGQYAVIAQLLTAIENVLLKVFLNGVEVPFPHAQPARHYPSLTVNSANITLAAVLKAQDGDILSIRVTSADGGSTTVYAVNSDITLLKVGAA